MPDLATVTCQHCLPAPHVPVCLMPLTQVEGYHVGTQGSLSTQRDAPRGPGGLAVQAGPSHTQLLAALGEEGFAPEFGASANKLAAVHPGDC